MPITIWRTRRTRTTISADGLTKTIGNYDHGYFTLDGTTTETTVLNADGSRTTTLTDKSRDGTLLEKIVTTISGNGLAKTISDDENGDGVVDSLTSDIIVLNADGGKTETVTHQYGSTLIDRTVTTTSRNGHNGEIAAISMGTAQSTKPPAL